MARTWKVKALIPFPMEAVTPSGSPVAGSLPERLEWASRIRPRSRKYGDVLASIRKATCQDTQIHWPRSLMGAITEPAEVALETSADSAVDALLIRKVEDLLERICDDLAFQLQLPIRTHVLEILDITPPVSSGESREILLFPFPQGFTPLKFMQSAHLGTTATERSPGLTTDLSGIGPRGQAALRWYHKALAAQFELDRFIFYWIVLEILCAERGKHVERPYINMCGHKIESCPTCNTSTSRRVNGPTLITFLTEDLGVDQRDAEALWRFRQMIHGANDLTFDKNEQLSTYCMLLRGAVTLALKRLIGLSDNALPSVALVGPAISTSMCLYGSRELDTDDLPTGQP